MKSCLTQNYYIKTKNKNKYYEGHVFGFEGVDRFVMGLPGEVKVIEPIELIEFIQERINRYNSYNNKN